MPWRSLVDVSQSAVKAKRVENALVSGSDLKLGLGTRLPDAETRTMNERYAEVSELKRINALASEFIGSRAIDT